MAAAPARVAAAALASTPAWLAAGLAVVLAIGCSEPPGRRTPAAGPALAKTDPARGLVYVRSGVAVARVPARGDVRELPVPAGEATAVAWGDVRTVYVASGLEVWRTTPDAGEPARVAVLRDEANDAIARLEARLDGRGLDAMTARATGAERFANARFWEIDAATGMARETSARTYDTLAGRRPRGTSELEVPLVSPTGRWELRVAGFETAVPGASERIVVRPSGGGDETTIADVRSLPAGDTRYTGIVDDAGWAAGTDTVLFVAETLCGETCSGALFAVDVDGSNLRRLGESLEEVPREWNGTAAAFDDFPSGTRTIVVVDVATGDRVDLGAGAGPKWQPPR
jgi:hypothetical protein